LVEASGCDSAVTDARGLLFAAQKLVYGFADHPLNGLAFGTCSGFYGCPGAREEACVSNLEFIVWVFGLTACIGAFSASGWFSHASPFPNQSSMSLLICVALKFKY
jgi:hypothetical protein